jgi:hypothetical protein
MGHQGTDPLEENPMKRNRLLLIAGPLLAMCAQAQTPPSAPPSGLEAALKAATEACKGETPQLCPGLSTDTAMACLQSNMDKLTPACKDAVTNLAKSALNLGK